MKINYLTSNPLKFAIAEKIFANHPEYELVQHSFEATEIQSESCEEIAKHTALEVARHLGEPCIVTDAGFFIPALNGFPGPFLKYINQYLNEAQILRLLDENSDRRAYFADALALDYPDGTAKVYTQRIEGRLAREGEYESSDWSANSLFIPEGETTPLGKLSDEERALFWANHETNWSALVHDLE